MRLAARLIAALAVFVSAFAAVPSAYATATVTVTNGGAPGWIRFDDGQSALESGQSAVDAHDGEIKEFGNRYYLYGTSYGCGYLRMHTSPVTPFCGFVAYESTDLRHWHYDGPLFDPTTTSPTNWQGICNSATLSCYRPHVLYDAANHQYRLWVNTYERGPDGVVHGYHVLSSSSPVGPFHEDSAGGAAVLPTLAFSGGGDFDVFQDTNGVGYIVYTMRWEPLGPSYGYQIVVEQLSRDYKTGTGIYTTLDTRHTEAPSMFRRGSDYYITMADPYCAYCAGTGTAYLRAKSPLGPWRGVGSNVALSMKQLYVDSISGLFTGSTPAMQSQLRSLRSYDIAFRARPLPDTTTSSVHTGRIGWMFRASDTGNGYLWVLNNRPYGKSPTRLLHEIVKNGRFVKTVVTGVNVRLSMTSMNVIRTRMIGWKIYTWLNGKLVDTYRDPTFHSGYAGVRETSGYSAYYDDVSVSQPASLGYKLFLADSFSAGTLANFPTLWAYRRHGIKISNDSCGGQSTDVAALRAPNGVGSEYLFQSDRWDHGDQNEGQATQYWEPLKFNADGSLQALLCGPVHTTVLTNATASGLPDGAPDTGADGTTPGLDGFMAVQDITSSRSRGQTFQVSGTANVTKVALTLFQTDDANGAVVNAPLTVSLYDVGATGGVPAGTPLVSTAMQPTDVGWSPRTMTVSLAAPVSPNPDGSPHSYAIVLSTTSTTGAYGTARADFSSVNATYDPDPNGVGLVSNPDGTWTQEPLNDLRYALTLASS